MLGELITAIQNFDPPFVSVAANYQKSFSHKKENTSSAEPKRQSVPTTMYFSETQVKQIAEFSRGNSRVFTGLFTILVSKKK